MVPPLKEAVPKVAPRKVYNYLHATQLDDDTRSLLNRL